MEDNKTFFSVIVPSYTCLFPVTFELSRISGIVQRNGVRRYAALKFFSILS